MLKQIRWEWIWDDFFFLFSLHRIKKSIFTRSKATLWRKTAKPWMSKGGSQTLPTPTMEPTWLSSMKVKPPQFSLWLTTTRWLFFCLLLIHLIFCFFFFFFNYFLFPPAPQGQKLFLRAPRETGVPGLVTRQWALCNWWDGHDGVHLGSWWCRQED